MKCAVVVPARPGDELYALDARDSVQAASAASRGPFAEIVHIAIDDRAGKLGPARARNEGIDLARRADAEWIFLLDARDVLGIDAFASVTDKVDRYDAIWGGIHELADDEAGGVLRPGQLLEIRRIDDVLANDPLNTLQTGHFVKTAVALATPLDADLGAGADFDYFLRLWRNYRCIKIPQPLYYERIDGTRGGVPGFSAEEWRAAARHAICACCVALDFRAEFTYRGENFRFSVANPFDLIHGSFLKGRFFELRELAFIEGWVGRGAAIVEVGAYVGNHVVYYARFMQPRTIVVLEPNPEAIALLRRNLQANRIETADLSHLGVGIGGGEGNYDLVCEGSANGGATRLVRADAGAVKSAALDDVIAQKVDFIKIDVEGMELEVLAGAARVIAESQPKIMIEVFRAQTAQFVKWLREQGYSVTHQFDNVHAVNYLIEPAHA